MGTPRHLDNAPITEALIDFRAELPQGTDFQQLSGLKSLLEDRYPEVNTQQFGEARLEVGPQGPRFEATPPQPRGYVFKTGDGLSLAQFRMDGLTVNRLKPYLGWRELCPEAIRLWALYRQVLRPVSAPRVAVRYINRLDLSDREALYRWLVPPPQGPVGAPGRVTEFLTRFVVTDAGTNVSSIVTRALQPSVAADAGAVLLDIDVFCVDEFVNRNSDVPALLETLRQRKNEIFFGSLTDEALARYQ